MAAALPYIGAVTGVLGFVLGLINLYLRWEDRRPRLTITAEVVPHRYNENDPRGILTVVNMGQVEATIEFLWVVVKRKGVSQTTELALHKRVTKGAGIPKRILPGERASYEYSFRNLILEFKWKGYEEGLYLLTPVVEDGRGNRYKGTAIRHNYSPDAV
jgi:hypothetical protein